jgi:hypothetical protein
MRVSVFANWIDGVIGPPKIIAVGVSGANAFDGEYALPSGSGDQIRSVPIGGVNEITVRFNEAVNITNLSFRLTSATNCPNGVCVTYQLDASFAGDNQEPEDGGGLDYEYNPDTGESTATFRLAQAFDSSVIGDPSNPGFDQVVLRMDDSHVTSVDNNEALDGEWASNPDSLSDTGTSRFPSGNWAAGGDFEFRMTIMPADHNGTTTSSPTTTNFVEQGDLDAVLINWGATGAAATFLTGDGDGNGQVEQGDLDHVLLRWGLDWYAWQGGPTLEVRRADLLKALDEAFDRLGLDEVWDSLHVNETAASVSNGYWEALMRRLVRALDSHYGVD